MASNSTTLATHGAHRLRGCALARCLQAGFLATFVLAAAGAVPGEALASGRVLEKSASAPGSAPAAPASHYWYDGDERRELSVDPARVADFRGQAGSAAIAKSTPAGPLRSREQIGKSSSGELPDGVSPVLREAGAPPGKLRALPGGVIVTLRSAPAGTDPAEREARARHALQAAQLVPLRPLDPSHRIWLVESPAGLASLELANRLHESGDFEQASPNWWRPRALK